MSDLLFIAGCVTLGLALGLAVWALGRGLTPGAEADKTGRSARTADWPGLGWLRLLRPLNQWRGWDRLKLHLAGQMEKAGYAGRGLEAAECLALKEILSVLLAVTLAGLGIREPVFLILSLLVGFFLPDIFLRDRIKARGRLLNRQLSPFLDLLAMALEAGLDFTAALELICRKGPQNQLSAEWAGVLQKIRLGWPRSQALRRLAGSLPLPSFSHLTAAIIQAETMGASLAPVLKIQADQLKKERSQRAEKLAHEAPVKMLLPLLLFIFPVLFIILFGPLAIEYFAK